MSDTDINSAQDLASLKLTELRTIAAQKGLRGVSGLRKGDLITAIVSGQVPGKAEPAAKKTSAKAAPQADTPATKNEDNAAEKTQSAPSGAAEEDKPKSGARRARRVVRSTSSARAEDGVQDSAQAEKAAASASSASEDAGKADTSVSNEGEGSEEHRYESRSQARRARRYRARRNDQSGSDESQASTSASAPDDQPDSGSERNDNRRNARDNNEGSDSSKDNRGDNSNNRQRGGRNSNRRNDRNDNRGGDNRGSDNRNGNGDHDGDNRNGDSRGNDNRDNNRGGRNSNQDDDNGRRGRRGRRNRRNRGGNDSHGGQNSNDMQVRDGDELQAVGGILEVVDHNVAFLRTTGYRAMSSDVFVNSNLVRRLGLRSGDAVTGQVKVGGATHSHGNGRNRRKYNQLVRVDTVNGLEPEQAKSRPQFSKLTPLYPNQRLRLETTPNVLTTRVIDLIMPIGKGQRALIVSPPKAGKTTILQNIANAIATNNPECYLMVVLVDERPEEVTDMQRSVKGEVIASTFDRPPSEHTAVAELAIERAKRLVEQGKDVVVLLDSITRLGRAYNNSSPASGRILSGGVDSNALYPPKRFLGAARNIEDGGSLTIIATAMVETGSTGDNVIFEEFKGTGNAELKLDRSISERRVFPAVDVNPSGTRKDELLLVPDELRIMTKLRRILSGLDSQQAIDLLIKQLKKTKSNAEFLMGIATSAPMTASLEEEDYS
ncbi:transcription termination factor Rho [Corynebacterium sp.]|uniref:transcription termination factor Rho n=1 Tax=Corynebacterium sp. TaxID=1720 RepID=UPI0026477EDE|nr:transcription termination factor Rho [Corynebacterium sp.]MDN6136604.1 transcription termination factor Rho [Corynebacterium sp.]MDN6736530.1 transcription termination factor Rho [Corynebacterium sp.]